MKIESLSFKYSDSDNYIIKNIELDLEAGKKYSIVGSNGSGKTHLIKCLMNLLNFQGRIQIDGTDIQKIKPLALSRIVSWFPQNNSISFDLTVGELVEFGRFAWHRGSPQKRDRSVKEEMLNLFDLKSFENIMLSKLSHGQKQRAFLARTLASKSRYILLDEPTNHLDIHYTSLLINYLKQLNSTIIMVHHHLPLCKYFSDYVVALKEGKMESILKSEDFSLDQMERVFDCKAEDIKKYYSL